MRVPAVLLAAVAVAGCLSDGAGSTEPIPTSSDLAMLTAGLPCEAPYTQEATTANLRRLNLSTFDDTAGPREMDAHGDLLLAARMDGFSLVDIAQPEAPRLLSHYGDLGAEMRDVKFSPDNLSALIAAPDFIDVVDIRDPLNPVQTDRWEMDAEVGLTATTANTHMVFPVRIEGQDWVFVAPQGAHGAWVLRLDGPPEARTLTYVTTTLPVQTDVLGTHDLYAEFDADRGQWLLYTADVFTGWKVFDVSDPTAPQLITVVPNHDGVSGTHSVQAARIGGRRIVATSTEARLNALKLFDATNLESPIPIGYWTFGPAGWMETQHNLNIVDGRLYLAHYANGLFVFDLTALPSSPTEALELRPIAHYMASHADSSTATGFWDLVVHEGLLYAGVHAGDYEQGLHVIGFGCITPGDPLQTSTG